MPQKPAKVDPRINQKLDGRYLLLELLGEGGSGKVYLGRHVQLGKRVAVKVLHRSLVHDERSVERFRKEAQSVANLDNPHIIQVFDYGQAPDGSPYIAMELLQGESFASRLNARRLPLDELLAILTQIVDGLGEAHALGFVHRDLRPRNIMLIEREGQKDYVKILDFGLAKIVRPGSDPSVSGVGFVMGDPTYSAPEQMKAQKIDGRTDLYALGIMTYQALAGQPPFSGNTVFEVMGKHLDSPVPPLEGSAIAVPRGIDAVLCRALAKNPQDRFPTVLMFLEALLALRDAPEVSPQKPARHPVFFGTTSYLNLQPPTRNDQTPVLARMPGGGVLHLPPGTPLPGPVAPPVSGPVAGPPATPAAPAAPAAPGADPATSGGIPLGAPSQTFLAREEELLHLRMQEAARTRRTWTVLVLLGAALIGGAVWGITRCSSEEDPDRKSVV